MSKALFFGGVVATLRNYTDQGWIMAMQAAKREISSRRWDLEAVRAHLARLIQPCVLGVYDRVAVYEVFAAPPKRPPLNVLTVAVFESADGGPNEIPTQYLNPDRIKIKGFDNWSFGVGVTRRPTDAVDAALRALKGGEPWALSGSPLQLGTIEATAPTFASPDGANGIPINRLLRNNFWNGSHVVRLHDTQKEAFQPFVEDRRTLQALSAAVQPHLPVQLATMIDFIGDILIQVPVTASVMRLHQPPETGPVRIEIVWHDKVRPRPVVAAARIRVDDMIVSSEVSDAFIDATAFSEVRSRSYAVEAEAWDVGTGLLVAATTPASVLSQAHINIHIQEPEPRVFTVPDGNGSFDAVRQTIEALWNPTAVGTSPQTSADDWRSIRGQLDEADRLAATRDFVQYRPGASHQVNAIRQRALDDVRKLIQIHGQRGIDLWDPFLSAEDLLQTLFFSQFAEARLRGLTDRREAPPVPGCATAAATPTLKISFAQAQRDTFAAHGGNRHGLNLEFRGLHGQKGWHFHDRFLIFPNAERGPLAWSLGTSVNQLGRSHHILQRVSNGALIAAAFNDLWNQLDEPDHLIWKSR